MVAGQLGRKCTFDKTLLKNKCHPVCIHFVRHHSGKDTKKCVCHRPSHWLVMIYLPLRLCLCENIPTERRNVMLGAWLTSCSRAKNFSGSAPLYLLRSWLLNFNSLFHGNSLYCRCFTIKKRIQSTIKLHFSISFVKQYTENCWACKFV